MAYNYEYPYTDISRSNSDWLLQRFKELTADYTSLMEWKETHEKEYAELKKLYDDITSGHFPQSVVDGLNEWIVKRGGLDLLASLVKGVYFGLTDNGYFVAYIPDSWSDIVFKTTGFDYETTEYDYGHLCLFMDV